MNTASQNSARNSILHWSLELNDPSGQVRVIPLRGSARIGRTADCEVVLRDPTAPPVALELWASPGDLASPFWARTATGAPFRLGDWSVRESQLPEGVPFRIGETVLRLSHENEDAGPALPEFPRGIRPWHTCSRTGRELLQEARRAAQTSLALYLAGETGTGKEVLARLLHGWSERKAGPFIPLHCGALALSLAESELFGHVKGAFTGAQSQRSGALMQAHGGTLFLDEVGDLPMDIQVKLLRFLEDGEIRPVGADRASRADVRLICATHHPLQALVAEGKFRRDLYYRIASVTLSIPTLRSRPDDIELLAKRFGAELGKQLAPRALLRLQAHEWPGNVRELRHAIERGAGAAGSLRTLLVEEDFEFLLRPENASHPAPDLLALREPVLSLEEMERAMLLKSLRLARGNRRKAAELLGIARSTLFEKLKRYRIQGPRSMEYFTG